MMENLSSFSLIFVGETHGFLNDFKKQEEIINKINPEFVLCEQLQDFVLDSKEKYLRILRAKKLSEMVSLNEVESLIRLCLRKGIKLIGMDLRNFGFDSRLQSIVKSGVKLSKEDTAALRKIMKLRESQHLRTIRKYLDLSSRPVVVFIGSWHLRKDSLLMNALNNYVVIYPCDGSGKQLLHASKRNTVVYYCERKKNEAQN